MRPFRALAFGTAGLVMAPFATITLPFRHALVVQAALALGLILALAARGFSTSDWRARVLSPSGGLNPAVLLWATAALLGTLVGILHGNGLARIAGQAFALGLLPLAFFAGRLLPRKGDEGGLRRAFVTALVGATALAASLQLLAWMATAFGGGTTAKRLFLSNSVGVSSLLPLVLVLAAASFRTPESLGEPLIIRVPWLRSSIFAVLLLVLVGSAVRGAWLATVFAFLIFWALTRTRPQRGTLVLFVAGALLGVALWISVGAFLDHPRPNRLPNPERISARFRGDLELEADGRLRWTSALRRGWVGGYLPADAGSLYRLRCQAWNQGPEEAYLMVSWRDDDGNHLEGLRLKLAAAGGPFPVEAYGSPPPGTTRGIVLVGADTAEGSGGVWEVSTVELQRLGPSWALPFVQQTTYLRDRIGSLLGRQGANAEVHQKSLSFRLKESRSLLTEVKEASWRDTLFGHGLGATFSLDGAEAHYIHNFFLFALYKLGILGSLLLLTGGGLWTAASLRQATASRQDLFLGAATAAWIAYWFWSVSSPEILNFRLAPIWGLLLAVQAGTTAGSRFTAASGIEAQR